MSLHGRALFYGRERPRFVCLLQVSEAPSPFRLPRVPPKSPSVPGAAASRRPFGSSAGWEGLLTFLTAVLSLATLLTLAALSSPHLYFQTWNSLFSALFLTSPGFPCSLQSASCRSQRTLACTMASLWCLHTRVAPCTLCGRSDSPPSASSTPCARVPLASPTTPHHLLLCVCFAVSSWSSPTWCPWPCRWSSSLLSRWLLPSLVQVTVSFLALGTQALSPPCNETVGLLEQDMQVE